MTRGRKPKPPNLRVIEGNREHRPIPECPDPPKKHISAPRWLDPLAKKEWRRISKELYSMGLLTAIDKAALEGYCQSYAKWKQAEQKAKIGVFQTKTGYIGQNPYINIAIKYAKEMRAFLVEFGLSPSSRTRINISDRPEEEKDTMEGLYNEA